MALGALLAAAGAASVGDPLAFCNAAPTVIPVFVLAGLYQAHAIESLFDPSIRLLAILVFLAAALIGEVSALHSAEHGTPYVVGKVGSRSVLRRRVVCSCWPRSSKRSTLHGSPPKVGGQRHLLLGVFAAVIVALGYAGLHAAERL